MLVVGLAAIFALTIYFYARVGKHQQSPTGNAPEISPNISERETDAARSWQILVSTTRCECAKDKSGGALDYELLHQYQGASYGVMVLAWPQSEYSIEVYKYDQVKKVWTASPRKATDFGDEIDVAKTSAKWGVPGAVIDEWVKLASDFMKKKYGNGDN